MAGRVERLGRAALENYSLTPLFNTKAVVRQTGVPAPTLRAWERRYGVLTPHRGENDYRLYSERDIAVIRWLREQVENGLSISQAIALLRTLTPSETTTSAPATREAGGPRSAAMNVDDLQAAGTSRAAPLEPGEPLIEYILLLHQASIRLDEAEASSVLARAFILFGVEGVIEHLIQPLMEKAGEFWASGQLPITIEHFVTAFMRAQLEALYRSEPTPSTGPLVLVGCAPGEYHELGALILALILRRQRAGLRVAYLGQNVEPEHLLESIQALRPAVVCVSASLPEHSQAISDLSHKLAALPAVQRPILVFGGRAFINHPELRMSVDGIYMNHSVSNAASIIQGLCLRVNF